MRLAKVRLNVLLPLKSESSLSVLIGVKGFAGRCAEKTIIFDFIITQRAQDFQQCSLGIGNKAIHQLVTVANWLKLRQEEKKQCSPCADRRGNERRRPHYIMRPSLLGNLSPISLKSLRHRSQLPPFSPRQLPHPLHVGQMLLAECNPRSTPPRTQDWQSPWLPQSSFYR